MEVGTSVHYRSTERKTEEQKLGTSFEVMRGVSPIIVVNFLTRSDSGTRDNTVYVVVLLVME